ncbi:MAG: FAD-binding oxidoreductase [Candidatus Saccharimonadales bacterium]
MMSKHSIGEDTSLWIDTTSDTNYPKLPKTSNNYDVAIVGGGITGILAAWFLQKAGLSTAIVEKDRIIANTTGNTTAKLTSQHYLIYDYLIHKFGKTTALAFANANQTAIDDIENLSKDLSIDCDFSRRDAYVYSNEEDKVDDIKKEVESAKSLGLPASFETQTDLPFEVKGAIKFTNQAQFHPRKFLLGVADQLVSAGGKIFEQTEAVAIQPGDSITLETKNGKVTAKYLVEATKYPFWQPNIFADATWTKLSYALGVIIDGHYPQGMYITTDDPIRSIRSHPYKNDQILIFGGESHKMTKDYDKDEHYQNLLMDVNQKFKVKKAVYHWIAGDNMTYDRLPYIGAYPKHPNIYVAFGFRAWGLAWAMAAAQIITSQILGESTPDAQPFGLQRLSK